MTRFEKMKKEITVEDLAGMMRDGLELIERKACIEEYEKGHCGNDTICLECYIKWLNEEVEE